jgi:dinuclear metal center YbgI/SA1388 family protein
VASTKWRVADLAGAVEDFAPSRWAADWDNVGLLVGDARARLSRVLLAIDCTREVVEEAEQQGCEAIVSYHPPLFAAQKRFVAPSPAFAAARLGLAIVSPHTALDVAPGGTNDVLADALGLKDRSPLRPIGVSPAGPHLKLVTFVPAEAVGAVSEALFAAGAGRIGKYTSCSFRSPGTGTFFGGEASHPAVGQAGRLEEAPELRLETLVSEVDAARVVRALRASHPYEEAAFDLVRVAPEPEGVGMGRVGAVDPPAHVRVFVERLKAALGTGHLLAVGSLDKPVDRVALCVGSGGELLSDALATKAGLFVTGELRHHDGLRAQASGLAVLCTLHSTSERLALGALERMLGERLAGLELTRSQADREPFAFV